MSKYELTDDTVTLDNGTVLHRIQALRDFGKVKAGDLGGYIEKESNLSHRGNCWVDDDAKVYGSARVFGNARVYDNARVFGDAWVSRWAEVYGNAYVYGEARVYGKAMVFEDSGKKVKKDSNSKGNKKEVSLMKVEMNFKQSQEYLSVLLQKIGEYHYKEKLEEDDYKELISNLNLAQQLTVQSQHFINKKGVEKNAI